MMIITERKLADYSVRVGEKRFVEENGKSLVDFVQIGNITSSGFLYIHLTL